MKYIVLLRKLNAGKENRIDMKTLKQLFEKSNINFIATYKNSGNIIISTEKSLKSIANEVDRILFDQFGHKIQFIIKSQDEIITIANSIPKAWQNNSIQRTDVAYLFKEIDKPKTIIELPVKFDFIEVKYVNGAIIWHLLKKNLSKSQLSKIISHPYYKFMTIRNANTARYIAQL
jgi:uncharacterized protein (DUF1697 family)